MEEVRNGIKRSTNAKRIMRRVGKIARGNRIKIMLLAACSDLNTFHKYNNLRSIAEVFGEFVSLKKSQFSDI